MSNRVCGLRFKQKIKKAIEKTPPFKKLLIFIYKLNGKRPWSVGYSFFKFEYIKNAIDKQLHYFRGQRLPPNYGFALDERVVEYPWFFARLKEHERIILDAGSALNHFPILSSSYLREKKLYIATLYYEGVCEVEPMPSYIFEDLRRTSFRDEFFDAIVCISTLEHIGMDNTLLYTPDQDKNEHEPFAFLEAVSEFHRVLKKGGSFYLTVPFGRHKNYGWFQIFDTGMIEKIKEKFSPAHSFEDYFKYEKRQWNRARRQDCSESYFFDVRAQSQYRDDLLAASESVACLELVK